MALTGPEKAMYNFLIKREAAGNLNASQKTALDALKAKVGPATPASPQPLKGKVVTAPPPPDAAKQAAAAKAAAAQKAAAAKAQAEKAKADAAKVAAAKKAEIEAAKKRAQAEAQKKLNEDTAAYERLTERVQSSLDGELASLQQELALMNMSAESSQALADAKEQEALKRELNAQLIGLEGDELLKAQETIKQVMELMGQLQEKRNAAMGPTGVAQRSADLAIEIEAVKIEMEQGTEAAERYRYEQEALAMATHLSADAHGEEVAALMAKYDELVKLREQQKKNSEDVLISEEQFARAVTNSIMSVVTGAESMQEAFLGLLQTLIEMIVQALIFKAIMTAIGGPAGAAAGAPASRRLQRR